MALKIQPTHRAHGGARSRGQGMPRGFLTEERALASAMLYGNAATGGADQMLKEACLGRGGT